jgi:hypothetical protein
VSPSDGARVGQEGSEAQTGAQGRSGAAVLTVEQAERLAAATLEAIRRLPACHHLADRERVASDLIGLQWCDVFDGPAELRVLVVDGLRRTAAL